MLLVNPKSEGGDLSKEIRFPFHIVSLPKRKGVTYQKKYVFRSTLFPFSKEGVTCRES